MKKLRHCHPMYTLK